MIAPELITRAQAGDREAVATLLDRLAPRMLRFGVRMCRDDTDAEDALQDALLEVTKRLPEFEGRSSVETWAFTVVRTACARRRRGKKNEPRESVDAALATPDEGPGPDAVAERSQLRAQLEEALRSLQPEHREVIVLRDIEGLSANEAAEVIGISVQALKSRLHRARSALREAVAPVLAPSPSCPDAAELLSRKLEGELSAEDCKEMEAHVAGCPSCSATCDALREVLGACKTAGHEVPPHVQEAVRRAIRGVLT